MHSITYIQLSVCKNRKAMLVIPIPAKITVLYIIIISLIFIPIFMKLEYI